MKAAGVFVESKEQLGGFVVVDVPDKAAARLWAEGSGSGPGGHASRISRPITFCGGRQR
jgi:hypothetical protein